MNVAVDEEMCLDNHYVPQSLEEDCSETTWYKWLGLEEFSLSITHKMPEVRRKGETRESTGMIPIILEFLSPEDKCHFYMIRINNL